jgi:hypothetical protein
MERSEALIPINVDEAVLGAGTVVSGESLFEDQGGSRDMLRERGRPLGDPGARTGEFLVAEAGRAVPGCAAEG